MAAGADTMVGGLNDDVRITWTMRSDVVTEGAERRLNTVRSALISYTLGVNVENLILGVNALNGIGNALNNTITGNVANNTLAGLDGSDTLIGDAGADLLFGGSGADTMIGGANNDGYYVDHNGDIITELANEGIDTVNSYIGYTLGANVENLVLLGAVAIGTGNAPNNTISGNAANNTLARSDGSDTLIGGAGVDLLLGGSGADTMIGGADNDSYYVDNNGDVVTELANEGVDTQSIPTSATRSPPTLRIWWYSVLWQSGTATHLTIRSPETPPTTRSAAAAARICCSADLTPTR